MSSFYVLWRKEFKVRNKSIWMYKDYEGCDKPDFTTLYKTYHGPIFGFVTHMQFTKHDSEDITQTTFLKAYRKYHTFRAESQPMIWLCAIARNTAYNFTRQKDRKQLRKAQNFELVEYAMRTVLATRANTFEKELFDSLDILQTTDLNTLIEMNELETIVSKAIKQLPEKKRRVIELQNSGLDYKELAEEMNIGMGTIRSLLRRARAELIGEIPTTYTQGIKLRKAH
jgi:RNA polymerase sigma-70 factor, ECF subfamily